MCYQLSSTKVYAQSVIDWTVVDRSTKLTIPANSDARPTAVVYHSNYINRHALSTTWFRNGFISDRQLILEVAGQMSVTSIRILRDRRGCTNDLRRVYAAYLVMMEYKKLSYSRWTARCVVSLKSCQLPRNSAETTYTTSPDQIDGMKLEI